MSRKKRKKQSPAIVSCKKGLACLGLICAVQMLPQTVLADDSAVQINPADSAVQVNPADSVAQVNPADSAVQVNSAKSAAQVNPAGFVQQADPADAAAQNSSADSAEADERLPGDQKEEAVEGVPADDAASFEGENTQNNVPEVLTGNADAGAAAVDDAESFEDESMPKSAPETSGSDADAVAAAVDKAKSPESEDVQDSIREAPENDANVNPAAPDEAVTGGDQMIADAETEKTKAPVLVLVSAGDAPTAAGEFPSRFDLRDLGVVTPVKSQDPWGTCWAFAATAASESSILTKMGKTYAETGLDLSERYLAWYSAQQVTENISSSQAGKGLHLYDENPNHVFLYGGKEECAGILYAQGIGPVPESDYPYRGLEGNLNYEAMLVNKDAYIESSIAAYKLGYGGLSDDELRSWAERDYNKVLSNCAVYDAYSQFDDWTISEADEPGSGRLRGSSYTLTDHNVFIYWVLRFYDDDSMNKIVDEFGREPLVELTAEAEDHSLILYQDSIDKIKAELISGRGVSVDFKWSSDTFKRETWAQFGNGMQKADPHGVCIVGWDDDYDASNFKITPPGNGAWIVKNSFGSQTDMIPGGLVAADGTTKDLNGGDWGIVDENGLHTGYFYLSYYDTTIGVHESFDFDLRENHDQENALQMDYLPSSTEEWVHRSENPMWCANVFTLEKDMRIDEVATRFALRRDVPLTGFTVTFDIYRLDDGAETPDDGELLASCTGEFDNFGYHRVALDAPVYGKAGERLSVVV